jgi:hypothetical protein
MANKLTTYRECKIQTGFSIQIIDIAYSLRKLSCIDKTNTQESSKSLTLQETEVK